LDSMQQTSGTATAQGAIRVFARVRPPAPGEALAAGAPAAVRVDAAAGAVDVVAGRCAAVKLAQPRASHIICAVAVVKCGLAPHAYVFNVTLRAARARQHTGAAWPWNGGPANCQRLRHCVSSPRS